MKLIPDSKDTARDRAQTSKGLKEFAFTMVDFEKVRALIYRRAGIALTESKHEMVYSRLARRLRATGMDSFATYLARLEQGQNAAEWEAFTNALTTNLTSFYRESHHFPILAEHLAAMPAPLTIWCSASSTGEEPYSIAMTACEVFNTLTPPVSIIATDIDTNVLLTAQQGVYQTEQLKNVSDARIKRFFLKGKGVQEGFVRVRPELGKLISFRQLNLLDERWSLAGQFDVIFCRNVMIYFDKPTQAKILARFVPLMKPQARLFAGHSENFLYVSNAYRLRGKTVYQLASAQGTPDKPA